MAWNFSWAEGSSGFLSVKGGVRQPCQVQVTSCYVSWDGRAQCSWNGRRQFLVDGHSDGSDIVAKRVMAHTWVVDHGHFAVGLLDLQIGRGGLYPQDIVIGGIDYHDDGGCRQKLAVGEDIQMGIKVE